MLVLFAQSEINPVKADFASLIHLFYREIDAWIDIRIFFLLNYNIFLGE